MSLVRGSSLQGFSELVDELGGDPWTLLAAARIPVTSVGDPESLVDVRSLLAVLEAAAEHTGAADFGRQLANRQGIEILGALGWAARTASTVGSALDAIDQHMAAYTPELVAHVDPQDGERLARFTWGLRTLGDTTHRQTAELGVGISLRVFRLLVDERFSPQVVLFRHQPLTDPQDYVRYYGCPVRFGADEHGFLFRRSVLGRPLAPDAQVHAMARSYLDTIVVPEDDSGTGPVLTLIRRMLPLGALSLEQVAVRLGVHPRTLQRRLQDNGTTYHDLVDEVRRAEAARYLTTTRLPLGQVSHLLGYSEQSVLSRSSYRWFGMSPRRTASRPRRRRSDSGRDVLRPARSARWPYGIGEAP